MPSRSNRRGRTEHGRAGEAGDAPVSERREAILAIAADIFARKGFAATTVREIADVAGILSGSLYHHFDSKESMVDEIIAGFIDDVLDDYEEVVATVDDPLRALEGLIRSAFAGLIAHRSALTIAQNESHYLQDLDRFRYLQGKYARVEELWTSVLARGVQQGVLRRGLDVKLAYALMRDAIWSTSRWYQPGQRHTIEQIADTYVALLLDGIRAAPPSPAAKATKPAKRAAVRA
jgi:AcrR family transcriptional regulator